MSGKAPVTAKNAYRTEAKNAPQTNGAPSSQDAFAAINNAQTEEDKLAALLSGSGAHWDEQQKKAAK